MSKPRVGEKVEVFSNSARCGLEFKHLLRAAFHEQSGNKLVIRAACHMTDLARLVPGICGEGWQESSGQSV